MEYEIDDDPQGEAETPDYDDSSEVTRRHRALRNQSSVTPEQYPRKDRRDKALFIPEESEQS